MPLGVEFQWILKQGGFYEQNVLVPIDISDSGINSTRDFMLKPEAKIDDVKCAFGHNPSLPYYTSLGLAYSMGLPAMDLKARADTNWEGDYPRNSLIPADRIGAEGSPKDKILEMAKNYRPIW